MNHTHGRHRNALPYRLYRYVGPAEIALGVRAASGRGGGVQVRSVADLAAWLAATRPQADAAGLLPATFLIDARGVLRLADRHAEHVACACGQPVRSAGEIFFAPTLERGATGWAVAQISNQSSGYCPEPESWPQVAAALERIPLAHPGQFTLACVFRRCPRCGQLALVKDALFVCAVCGADLPARWNIAANAADAG